MVLKEEKLSKDVIIYLADCREVLPTFDDGAIDFIFTDPPYGHNNNNGDKARKNISNELKKATLGDFI